MNQKELLTAALASALSAVTGLEPRVIRSSIEKPRNRSFGDLAFPCFALTKQWRLSPAACAERLAGELALPEGFSEAVPAGPFLNFRYDRPSFVRTAVSAALAPPSPQPRDDKVIVEYSSPNIAKPFHVGHLRATLIGNCLDRVYRFLGYKTTSINHLGDWGTQFGFVWAGCKLWGFPENPSVRSLVELYRRATALKQEQEQEQEQSPASNSESDVNAMARCFFLDLEKGESYAVEFWRRCVDISLDYLRATYARLDIHFDHYTGESFYSDKLDGVRQMLEKSGLLSESQGALGVDLGPDLGFARILTPDGRSLYLTRDIATAVYRAEHFAFDRAIYVVGAPQTLHFNQLKGVLRALGLPYAEKIIHVPFGHVLGMKTRGGGEFIELNDFLDDAFELALEAYRTQVTKRPEGLDEAAVAKAVALAAIIFSNLSRSNIKDVNFKWEHALGFQGDSGPYLLYACARINGIREKAREAGISAAGQAALTSLQEESAFELAQTIADFHEVLERTAAENEPSILAAYALDLAKAFSQAYLELKVVGEAQSVARDRLALFEATHGVLATALGLLGMQPLERM